MKKLWFVVMVMSMVLVPATAVAEEANTVSAEQGPTFGVGARIGGYGFREVKEGSLSWADCRMNGTGVFGTVDVGEHLFGELSADLYHATEGPVSHGMDRVSFLPTGALGARMLPDKLISPYVQAGGGAEFTRIDLHGLSDRKVLPTAFMGLGGELNIQHFHFGSNLKVFTMGLPKQSHGVTHAHSLEPSRVEPHDEAEGEVIPVRYELAAMMQFFVRYHF